jgi:hypothetical protein
MLYRLGSRLRPVSNVEFCMHQIHIRFDRNGLSSTLFQTSNLACIEFKSHLDLTAISQRHAVPKHNGLAPFNACLFGAIWRQIQIGEAMFYY